MSNRIRRKIIPKIDLTEYKLMEEIAEATYLAMEEINVTLISGSSLEQDSTPFPLAYKINMSCNTMLLICF